MKRTDEVINSCFGEPSIGSWEDETYKVFAFQEPGSVRLDIFRHDLKDGITWDELQRIKSECGFGGKDGVEMYPRDEDVVNTANIRHLYIFEARLLMVRRMEGE